MKKVLATATITTGLVASSLTVPQLAGAATCSTQWGSLAKKVTNYSHTTLYGLRTGRHECFDRLVLDRAARAGYSVRYVSAVRNQGEGAVVPLRGGAFLQIDDQSMVTRRPAMPSVTGYSTFRQLAYGGSFEGYTTIGLGVRARLPFRVFHNGPDLVIDVAHRW